jgi:alkanesulfonate monooxygenase SsuD/methylene tetrahydromethanopterin reductase-like flavin-dependent oxidoreductase (luciferase family)
MIRQTSVAAEVFNTANRLTSKARRWSIAGNGVVSRRALIAIRKSNLMQFGLFGSAAARRGGPEFDSSEGFRDFIEYNIEAEALGFHSTFVVEHHFTGYGQVSATLNLLTWLGARARWLRLGTAVIVLPWHNPVLLAEQAATLDLLSGGRLDFGIGKGYRYNEFAGFCVPMEEADARFDEALDVILKAWTTDEPFSHRGKYWQFDSIVVEPPPAQRPHPQIWMGAGSERSIRRVAAQGFNLLLGQYASPRDVAWNIAVYKSEVEAHGRCFDPMQVGVTRAFFVADNMAEREAAMDRRLQNRMRQLKLATRPDGTVHGGPDRATGDPRAVNEASAMYGNPDDIAKKLEELREVGVSYVLLNGGGSGGGARGRKSLRRFAREVMPVFAGR